MAELKLDSPLQFVKGVGPRKAEVMALHGIETVRDLLFYLPRAYLDRTNVAPIIKLKPNDSVTIIGEVKAHGLLYGRKKRYEVILQDQTAAIALVWFGGIKYFQRMFQKGQFYAATGTVSYFQGMQIVHPDLERLEDDTSQMVHAGRIIPVYPQTSELSKHGLNSKGVRRLTTFVLDNLSEQLPDALPPSERSGQNLLPLHDSVVQMHYPDNQERLELARRRLAFDELTGLQFFVYRNKGKKDTTTKSHTYSAPGEKLTAFKETIGFSLTEDQRLVTREIFDDLRKTRPMSRLLHGEVGSGKTVVAVIAGLYAAENNLQTAFMAPTEILAEQHYRNWHDKLQSVGVRSGLLTSSLSAADKKAIATRCANGEIDVLFGTHALIYDYVSFSRLGLVIIDEQHRFGVEQRGKLYAKGDDPDLLVMTATPIPRTLALTLYGDLDISAIKTLPPGRKPIRTVWRTGEKAAQLYSYIRDEVSKGGQAYMIYPLIEKSDSMELQSVEESYEQLTATVFRDISVGLVHGRIKPKERDEILRQFRDGSLSILMSTTVIEVGIDNPNATLLVIEHAERFGLAQLHQLRGRVGRGEKAATVVALAYSPISDTARRRLEYFTQHADGFEVAEADLQLRGPGELFGVRQSGAPELRAASLTRDRDLLESSRILVIKLFSERDKLDSEYSNLYAYLEHAATRRDALLGGG